MLGRLVNDALETAPPRYPWGDTMSLFKKADFRFLNLECVISDKGTPWVKTPKTFHFRSGEKNIRVLKEAKIDCVSVANNHALDYSEEAFLDMLIILKTENILSAGSGRNIREAREPAIFEKDGFKIYTFAFTDNEPQWEAGKAKSGIFYMPTDLTDKRAKNFLKQIDAMKNERDLFIVSPHWGGNWGYQPPTEHIVFAHALVDAGIDIILGTSPHICRGIEIYNKKPIFYSLGNFIDDYTVNPLEPNDESFVFQVETEGKIVRKIILIPTIIENFQAKLAPKERAEAIMDKMGDLCHELGTAVKRIDEHLEISIRNKE
ncbi:MAG: CapA family protein [Patescibacteria group bacterium]|nr:CapA family protein [Patescibacteria group bacterium]